MFKVERKSQFIDIDANKILVEYGTEEHTEILPNGAEIKFNRKVRVTLYNGKKITLYQTLSTKGVRYHTLDKKFTFVEKGTYCQIFEKNLVIYQGIFSKNLTKKKK
ncbi:MAG: hypothetical protein PF904_04415 [Kiritimatiellae bacterium]|nr:hypothetical protein [Kiritimatiellia bacterium]